MNEESAIVFLAVIMLGFYLLTEGEPDIADHYRERLELENKLIEKSLGRIKP
jgi:hypothetical protein